MSFIHININLANQKYIIGQFWESMFENYFLLAFFFAEPLQLLALLSSNWQV